MERVIIIRKIAERRGSSFFMNEQAPSAITVTIPNRSLSTSDPTRYDVVVVFEEGGSNESSLIYSSKPTPAEEKARARRLAKKRRGLKLEVERSKWRR